MQQNDTILDVREINTHYGSSHVLFDVSLTVSRDEIVALIGRNGAGKSTILRSIMGVTPPSNGMIQFKDEAIQGLEHYQIRTRGVSWVPEDRRIFADLSVDENLDLAAIAGKNGYDKETVFEYFPRLEERRGQSADTLSGGEQQMLALSRALLGPKPELLLLDEPSEGLAPQIVATIEGIIKDINREGISILLVEQNAELALTLSDRAYIIETGRIVHHGPSDEIIQNQTLINQYLGVK